MNVTVILVNRQLSLLVCTRGVYFILMFIYCDFVIYLCPYFAQHRSHQQFFILILSDVSNHHSMYLYNGSDHIFYMLHVFPAIYVKIYNINK